MQACRDCYCVLRVREITLTTVPEPRDALKTSEIEASVEVRRAPAILAAREPSALPESCPALMPLPRDVTSRSLAEALRIVTTEALRIVTTIVTSTSWVVMRTEEWRPRILRAREYRSYLPCAAYLRVLRFSLGLCPRIESTWLSEGVPRRTTENTDMKAALLRLLFPILIAVALFASCYHSQTVDVKTIRTDPMPVHDRITEVTLSSGREINFDRAPSPSLLNDTLRGTSHGAIVSVPMDSVQRLWVARIDVVRTTLAVVGVAAGLAVAIAAITYKSPPTPQYPQSCPYIYSWDGQRYVLEAQPYGGAITRGLERDDYEELPSLVADQGIFRLLMANEEDETQYTNQLQLMVVDHPPGITIRADEFGNFYAFDSLFEPTTAHDQDGHDLRPWLTASDHLIWEPLAPPDRAHGTRQDITFTFAKPPGAMKGFLVARVSTGQWGAQMIRRFSQLRGTALADWYEMIDTSRTAAAALHQWNLREELYALKVAVEEPAGWEVRGVILGGGPLLATDRVVPLDLSHVRGDSVHVRIRPPYGFWALNSFAMAYRTAGQVRVTTVEPATAKTSDGRHVLEDLRSVDTRYYSMPTTGDYGFVTFVAPPVVPGATRTVFAHARGYYRMHLVPTTPPDSATLAKFFSTPDAAALFAADRYADQRSREALAP